MDESRSEAAWNLQDNSGKGVAGGVGVRRGTAGRQRGLEIHRVGEGERSSRDDARWWAVLVGYRPGFGKSIRDGVCGISVGNTEFVGGRIQV